VFGMSGAASAFLFDTNTVTLNLFVQAGDTVDVTIPITGFTAPPGTITSASLTLVADRVHGQPDTVSVDPTDISLGQLNGQQGQQHSSTTIFNNQVFLNAVSSLTIPGSLTIDVTAGDHDFTLVSYDLQIDPIDSPTSVPEPCTVLLLGSGLVGIAAFRKKLIA